MTNLFRPCRSHVAASILAFVLSQAAFFPVHAGPVKGAGATRFPQIDLPQIMRGETALSELGARLPDLARAYGLRPEDLQSLFRQDPTLAVDRHGRLHFTDPKPDAAFPAEPLVQAAAAIPLEDTFKLHSRPGAKRTIYLDFDGHVLSGTAWNSAYNGGRDIIAPPWDIDGVPGSFNSTERTIIQEIWRRVSEDYAPFDVDVTTELTSESLITRSSTSDEYYGTRVLISPISSYFGSYGGVAYVGVFDDVGDFYKPALVFPENLGPNGARYIAEAASHEAGHNLGLSHDGTTTGSAYYSGQGSGATSWAPIMGVGYYANVTQWSKGEYANANNKEDDLAVMQTYGLSYRADDHGNSAAAASFFPAGAQLSASGVIERSTDIDVFGFTTGAGNVSLAVSPAEIAPNLDIFAELRDSTGALIATNNPATLLSASFNLTLSAGTYFLYVRGTGYGDPLIDGYTSYASLGNYSITGLVVDPSGTVPPVASILATPQSGMAPLVVQLTGTNSFDQDGSIVSYAWNFGDGTSGSGANVSHTYSTPGTYNALLTVTDNSGLAGTNGIVIQVTAPNIPPVASATASPVSGYAPLAVTLDGSGSFDSDGSISSFQWNFGDGTTGSGVTVSHTYSTVGSYTATLTVTDNRGATGSASVQVQATSNPVATLRVQSIALAVLNSAAGKSVRATVKVTDVLGNPVAGVTVNGSFNSVAVGTGSAVTDTNGNAVITSKRSKKSGTVTFTVTGLSKSGWTYDASQNLQSSATIALAP